MPPDRAERLALVEAGYRIANERMAGWEERHVDGAAELYLCECGAMNCRGKVRLTREQYEKVRASSVHFVLIPGHEAPDVEDVIARGDGFLVVQKHPPTHPLAIEADPRQDHSGPARDEAERIAREVGEEPPGA